MRFGVPFKILKWNLCFSPLPGHHQQREESTGQKRPDPDVAAGVWGAWQKPAGEQLWQGQLLVGGEPRRHDGGVGRSGLLGALAVWRQKENSYITALQMEGRRRSARVPGLWPLTQLYTLACIQTDILKFIISNHLKDSGATRIASLAIESQLV